MGYLKIVSWHVIERVDDTGWHTRCGRTVTVEKVPASDTIPLDEKSCEACLRLSAHDTEPRNVDNDTVPA